MKKCNIVIADANMLFGQLLKMIITENSIYDVLSVEGSGIDAIKKSLSLQPDLLIMGNILPDITMYQVVKEVLRRNRDTSFMFILSKTEPDLLRFLRKMTSVGAVKDSCSTDEFLTALNSISSGDRYISRGILEDLKNIEPEEQKRDMLSLITPREREILFWISKGYSNKEIAERIILSEKTVKNHVSHILKKLNINDRTKAAAIAWEEGLGFIPEDFFLDLNMW